MSRFRSFVTVLSCLSLVGCGSAGEDDTAVEDEGIQPQAGYWTVVTTGWANDDCNAEEGLAPPSAITFSDVASSSFEITLYDGDVRIGDGSSTCTYEGDDIYD